jgi:hypothetical protein
MAIRSLPRLPELRRIPALETLIRAWLLSYRIVMENHPMPDALLPLRHWANNPARITY